MDPLHFSSNILNSITNDDDLFIKQHMIHVVSTEVRLLRLCMIPFSRWYNLFSLLSHSIVECEIDYMVVNDSFLHSRTIEFIIIKFHIIVWHVLTCFPVYFSIISLLCLTKYTHTFIKNSLSLNITYERSHKFEWMQ